MLDCNRLSAITQCAQYRYINVHYCDFIRTMPRIILEFDVKHYDQTDSMKNVHARWLIVTMQLCGQKSLFTTLLLID